MIYIHILSRHPILERTAQERLISLFLPTGPLHMLPPTALETMGLSTTVPNEVVTVALSVDDKSGELYGFRVFPSVIGNFPSKFMMSVNKTFILRACLPH